MIGSGSFGQVFLVTRITDRRVLVMKKMSVGNVSDKEMEVYPYTNNGETLANTPAIGNHMQCKWMMNDDNRHLIWRSNYYPNWIILELLHT